MEERDRPAMARQRARGGRRADEGVRSSQRADRGCAEAAAAAPAVLAVGESGGETASHRRILQELRGVRAAAVSAGRGAGPGP